MEAISNMKTIVFDKTGTLTKGEFKVTHLLADGCSKEKLIELVACAESFSNHPIAVSVRNSYGKAVDMSRISDG